MRAYFGVVAIGLTLIILPLPDVLAIIGGGVVIGATIVLALQTVSKGV